MYVVIPRFRKRGDFFPNIPQVIGSGIKCAGDDGLVEFCLFEVENPLPRILDPFKGSARLRTAGRR